MTTPATPPSAPVALDVPGVYAGVGSRQTPGHVLDRMRRIAGALSERGWILRSGGADGADDAFGTAALYAQIYLPWPGFNGWKGPASEVFDRPTPLAYEIAARHHPGWQYLSRGPRALHARNVHQVLGASCTAPAAFVLCWTPDGATTKTTAKTGGTGQAIRIAVAHGVPVWNLARPDHWEAWTHVA